MNTEFFIAKRLYSGRETKNYFSRPIVTIAIIGISLGLIVMLLSVSIMTGFKQEIRNKVIGFSSHIQITNYNNGGSYQLKPISKNQPFYPSIKATDEISHIQIYATIPGIIKTQNNIQGVVLKGVGSDYDWSFFENYLVAGSTFQVNDSNKTEKVLISNYLANLLKLDVGDDFRMYFVQQPPRVRKFVVSGIYETDLMEFDELFIIGDIGHVQSLNEWSSDQISGFEITVSNIDKLNYVAGQLQDRIGYSFSEEEQPLKVMNIKDKYPQIFDWLSLLDMNTWIILLLMVMVAGFNMVSGLLIIILERTNLIGILKSLGAKSASIRKIFLYHSGFMITRGLIWGNIIGLAICALQYYFGVIRLDPNTYYLQTVPINFNIMHILAINIGTLIITTGMLVIPSMIISRIMPDKTLRFE